MLLFTTLRTLLFVLKLNFQIDERISQWMPIHFMLLVLLASQKELQLELHAQAHKLVYSPQQHLNLVVVSVFKLVL